MNEEKPNPHENMSPEQERETDEYVEREEKKKKLRTDAQNRAMHKFFEVLAEDMNLHGIDLRMVLIQMQFADISATKQNVKDFIWRPFQIALLNKKSTTELEKQKEIDLIWDNLNRFFSDKFKYQIPYFPSIEQMMIDQGVYDHEPPTK